MVVIQGSPMQPIQKLDQHRGEKPKFEKTFQLSKILRSKSSNSWKDFLDQNLSRFLYFVFLLAHRFLQFATSLIFTPCSICNFTFCPSSGLFGNFQTLEIISRINLICPRAFVCFVLQLQLIRLNFSTCHTAPYF